MGRPALSQLLTQLVRTKGGGQERPGDPVQNVKHAVAVGLQQQFARLSNPQSTSTTSPVASQSCVSLAVNW